MPNLTGVLETALYVDDLPRAIAFYRNLFGFETLNSDQRFCAMSVSGRQVLLLFKKGDGVTRASRAAKLLPGTLIRVEIVGDLPAPCGQSPTLGDHVP